MLGNAGSTALPFLFCKGLKGGTENLTHFFEQYRFSLASVFLLRYHAMCIPGGLQNKSASTQTSVLMRTCFNRIVSQ